MENSAPAAPFQWGAAIDATFQQLSQQFVQIFPQLLGTVTLLLVGYLLAKTLALSTRKLVEGLDALFVRLTHHSENAQRERIQRSWALLAGRLVFWAVLLFFFAVGSRILGWNLFSGWLDRIVGYVPGLVTGLIIMTGGFILGNLARSGITTAAQRAALEQSAMIARVAQVVIVFSAVIIGIEQIGLNVDFLSNIIVVVVGILLGGAALAFSLGARTLVANVIGAQYTRRHCRPGDHLRIGAVEGEILEISQASIVVATEGGKAVVPAKQFHEEVCIITARQNQHLQE